MCVYFSSSSSSSLRMYAYRDVFVQYFAVPLCNFIRSYEVGCFPSEETRASYEILGNPFKSILTRFSLVGVWRNF